MDGDTSSAAERPGLLRLPRELRDNIYQHLPFDFELPSNAKDVIVIDPSWCHTADFSTLVTEGAAQFSSKPDRLERDLKDRERSKSMPETRSIIKRSRIQPLLQVNRQLREEYMDQVNSSRHKKRRFAVKVKDFDFSPLISYIERNTLPQHIIIQLQNVEIDPPAPGNQTRWISTFNYVKGDSKAKDNLKKWVSTQVHSPTMPKYTITYERLIKWENERALNDSWHACDLMTKLAERVIGALGEEAGEYWRPNSLDDQRVNAAKRIDTHCYAAASCLRTRLDDLRHMDLEKALEEAKKEQQAEEDAEKKRAYEEAEQKRWVEGLVEQAYENAFLWNHCRLM